ncbi:MAG: RidA family protein [Planctomyces sp.]|nr:RidA family protein [Planctomyces sp.]
MFHESRLEELKIILPEAPKPVAAYVPAVRTGDLVFVSGQLPLAMGSMTTGKVPSKVSVEAGAEAARACLLNSLAVLRDVIGNLSKLRRVVRIGVFVQCDSDFTEQALVANGASELLQRIFGDIGRHARTTIGVPALPLNASVEVEAVYEVLPQA